VRLSFVPTSAANFVGGPGRDRTVVPNIHPGNQRQNQDALGRQVACQIFVNAEIWPSTRAFQVGLEGQVLTFNHSGWYLAIT
jgi:hypothetical protein